MEPQSEPNVTDTAVHGIDCASGLVVCRSIRPRRWLEILAVASTILIVSSIIAWSGDVGQWEQSILRFFNGWPDALKPAMWFLQQPGVLFAPVVAGVVIYWRTRVWQHLIAFAMVLPLKLLIEKGLVKQLVERERPFTSIGTETNVRGGEFDGPSFPSGHTTTAFALGILLAAFLPPKWRSIPLIWAVIVAIARMYYGEHNFLDVVAGAAIGTIFATTLWLIFLNRFASDRLSQ